MAIIDGKHGVLHMAETCASSDLQSRLDYICEQCTKLANVDKPSSHDFKLLANLVIYLTRIIKLHFFSGER
jgi:hypothetical protein